MKQHGKRRVLGLLDIYGFENLTTNSFEQLIINYCNEKLHQHVTEVLLKEEQEEYVYEGLEWTPVPYVDNSAVCDLIDKVFVSFVKIMQQEEEILIFFGLEFDWTFINFGRRMPKNESRYR